MTDALKRALEAYEKHKYTLTNHTTMAYIDMRLHSSKPRLFLYDLTTDRTVGQYHVAHGVGSCSDNDKGYADKFSNLPNSHKSSLGGYTTGAVYVGKHGKSLRLHGLDQGVNHLAFKRAIVIHAADYVTCKFIKTNGRAGCSWGCPAICPCVRDKIIGLLQGGAFLYIHY